jgi:hypothetical protein
MYSDPDILTETPSRTERQGIVLSEVLEVLGKRSFVPVIAIPSLVGMIPSAGSVLISAICGLIIGIAAFQLIMGCAFLHLPSSMAHRYSRSRFGHFIASAAVSVVDWLDEVANQKLVWIQGGFISLMPNVVLLIVALALPVLTWLGQPTLLICTSILIYCVSLLTRDGRYTVFSAITLSVASVPLVLQLAG